MNKEEILTSTSYEKGLQKQLDNNSKEIHEEINLTGLEELEKARRRELIRKEQVSRSELYCLIAADYHQLYRNGATLLIGGMISIVLAKSLSKEDQLVWTKTQSCKPKLYKYDPVTPKGSYVPFKSCLKRDSINAKTLSGKKVTILRYVGYLDFREGTEKLRKMSHWREIQTQIPANLFQMQMLHSEYGRDSTYQESWCDAQERLNHQLSLTEPLHSYMPSGVEANLEPRSETGGIIISCEEETEDDDSLWIPSVEVIGLEFPGFYDDSSHDDSCSDSLINEDH